MEQQTKLEIEEALNNDFEKDPQLQALAKSLHKDQPKIHKIKDFKSRILGLLQIYVENTKQHQYFIKALKGVFKLISFDDILKLDKMLNIILKRGANNIQIQDLNEVIQQYKVLLMKTKKNKDSQKLTQTFGHLLQFKLNIDENGQIFIKEIILDFLQKYINKRLVYIHPQTFRYLTRKFKFTKDSFYNQLLQQINNQNLRQSMKKQLKKMIDWFQKSKGKQIKIQ